MTSISNKVFNRRDEQTIIAQCTPRGSGAIALLRLSGDNAITIADHISKLASGARLSDVQTHTIHYGWVLDAAGANIDHVMFSVMHAPKTFTGQNTVEITCHNNQFIIEAIIERAIVCGARIAQPGEFTERAFINNKLDLTQAEALNDLIHAQNQQALKKALSQLEGSFSHWIAKIETELLRTLAWCEASFEFLDEEEEFGDRMRLHLETLQAELVTIKKTFDVHQHIRQGVRVAIIGSVNAGKSSLFNMLLGQKRSIVTSIAGTTRDSIEAGLYRGGTYWTLIDTAGIRKTEDIVESEGIKRSLEEAQKADIILLVYDGSRPVDADEALIYQQLINDFSRKIILVHNKSDLADHSANFVAACSMQPLRVSALDHALQAALESAIEAKISTLFEGLDAPFLLNERQFNLLRELEEKIAAILGMLQGTIQYELVSHHLRDALESLTSLTGKSVSEAGMDMVFREFCVGK